MTTVYIDQELAEQFMVTHHAMPVEHAEGSRVTIYLIEGEEWLQTVGNCGEYRLEKIPA